MKKIARCSLAAGLLLALLGVVSRTPAQDATPGKLVDATEKTKTNRVTYFVHRGSAADLAKILASHFKGAAEVQALPDSLGNCLLISGPAAAADEVLKLLAQIDRRPQTIAVEVFVAEIPAKKDDESKSDRPVKELDPKQFTGSATDLVANLQALCDEGRIGTLRLTRLTVVEGLPSSAAMLENKPFVTGINVTATGHVSRNITYRTVGVQAKATARITADQKIELALEVSDSRMVPDSTVVLGKDENGAPLMAMDTVNARFVGKLTLSSGSAAAADGVTKSSKAVGDRTLVIVSAKVIDPDAQPEQIETAPDRPIRPRRPPRQPGQPPPPPKESIDRTNPN